METNQEVELKLVQEWQETKRLPLLEMMKVAYRPMLNEFVKRFDRYNLRVEDVRNIVERHFADALDTFDPTSSKRLSDWVYSTLEHSKPTVQGRLGEVENQRRHH